MCCRTYFCITFLEKTCCRTYFCNTKCKNSYTPLANMGKEIERKFLTKDDTYRQLATGIYYRQGYIPTVNGMTVRVRIAGERAFTTFKDHAVGLTRHEFEYEIPVTDAQQMLSLMCAQPQIEKHRYIIPLELCQDIKGQNCTATLPDGTPVYGLHWEVDEFHGDNEGLVVAELEVPSEEVCFTLPAWIGDEVTGDHRFYNSQLCRVPFSKWNQFMPIQHCNQEGIL